MVDNIYHFPKWFLSISIDVFCEITKKKYPKKNSIFNSKKQNQKKPPKTNKTKNRNNKKK